MKNLIILGNGFDLAHALETGYGHFINYIFEEHFKDKRRFNKLLSVPQRYNSLNNLLIDIRSRGPNQIRFGSGFVELLVSQKAVTGNWSDIESLYFETLNDKYTKPRDLNIDFENLKDALQEYLCEQQPNVVTNAVYKQMFENLTSLGDETLVLSFNYTDTFERLYEPALKRTKSLYIHGKLFDPMNPIIFGYAADDIEINSLIDKRENAYLKNIKRHCYKRTPNEKMIKEFLGKKVEDRREKINVFVFGHSCSLSDKLILNEIMNHENVDSISIMYYETADAFFDSHINLYRIMRNNVNYDKIVNFQESCRMPQIKDAMMDSHEFYEWGEKIAKDLLLQKRRTKGGTGLYML